MVVSMRRVILLMRVRRVARAPAPRWLTVDGGYRVVATQDRRAESGITGNGRRRVRAAVWCRLPKRR